MKKLMLFTVMALFFGFKSKNEIDENKMNRDLEIAKNILSTLIQGGSDNFFGGNAIEASYIQDYGVVFTIPEHLVYFHVNPGTVIAMPDPPDMEGFKYDFNFDSDYDVIVTPPELSEETEKAIEKEMKKQEKEMEKQLKKNEEEIFIIEEQERRDEERARRDEERARMDAERMRQSGRRNVVIAGSDDEEQIDWEEIMITFMTDYADLIGQLQPDDKIVIKQKSPYNDIFVVWNDKEGQGEIEENASGITAEVFRKDIQSYKSGKIDKDEFIERISIDKKSPPERNADLEMFTSIFDRYYSSDLSKTFYAEGKPGYELLNDFGAIVHIRVAGPGNRRLRFYKSSGTTIMSQNEEAQNDEQLYKDFKVSIKEFMLDYGRTVRSLNKDEKLRLEIKINSCRECQVPKMLEVSADIALLEQYDLQKISKEKALAAIETNEQF